MKNYIVCLLCLYCFAIHATQYTVGAGQLYQNPRALYLANVLVNGDTINILNGTYTGLSALANWNKDNLVIRGINGRPHMKANGQNQSGKAIWITSGNNILIDNIEFSECTVPDHNGAGIRHEAHDLTIRHCYFHDNENGILTNNPFAGHIDIQYSEFGYNGYSDGFTHNVYIGHHSKLTFKYNYSHHAKVGHNLKSRANENIIMYNRIMDEATGNSSRLIDISNGGLTIVVGNLLMQGPLAINNNILGYGLEGLSNSSAELYVVNNTFVNKRSTCNFIHTHTSTTYAMIVNNIFAGNGNLVNGPFDILTNNLIETNIGAVLFVDEPNYNYRLQSSSSAINGGMMTNNVNGMDLTPTMEYLHQASFENRPLNSQIDIGAYEYIPSCSPILPSYTFMGLYDDNWINYANWSNGCTPPSVYSGNIMIDNDCILPNNQLQIIEANGQLTINNGYRLTIR